MKKFLFALVSTIILFAVPSHLYSQSVTFWDDMPNEELAHAIVDQMSDTELYAQILMFGWAGAEPDKLLYDWVERGLGNVKVFGWNTNDIHLVAKSVSSLQKNSQANRFKIPLFVATDQEGGSIRHVKGDTLITPGNMAIGASGYPLDSWYSAYYISREIKALGINMNFAPTVDLFTNHESSIIGIRSFGDDPQKTGILGAAFSAGTKAAGVIPTVKHFPGHGDTDLDSHGRLPQIDIDFETFKNRELIPYIYLIKENTPAIMSGHLSFPQIDKTGAPASLSKFFLTDLLRGQLGYEGLIITDDMEMVGATIYAGTISNAFKLAIEAGNDIILSSRTANLEEALWYKNLNLMTTDNDFRARVKDAAYRVLKAKLEYFKSGNQTAPLYPDPDSIDQFIPDKEGDKFFLEQACRSITVQKQGNSFPIDTSKSGKILIIGSLTKFFNDALARYPQAGQVYVSYETGPNETQWIIDQLPSISASYNTIIICVSNENHVKIAQYFRDKGKNVIILSTMSPELTKDLSWCDTILLGYSWRCEYSLTAMLGALNGEFVPKGEKPYR